ncbi:MAG: transcriptional repressor LexA [Ignavibacteriota bacterium]|jgi:repressor LexA|nr:transcriptional repressor LexA [Ignavibacteriota bacterium]MCO6446636.1 transcriptional repressor LexA [Ignavibacterium album]MCZ2269141.1 transcriptional repressor LexA [Ignavibacteriales bacterium]MDX9711261.1 transcriptional repressor LexA [Ignavibacteriaceae bacterium]MEB2353673.1 transcriptional repressor LexA [Ignavibacteriales bacterium]
MKKKLTERQEKIFIFIQEYQQENGYPPTLREIGKKFDILSTFGVKRHLEALTKKGYLNILSNASRGISINKNESESLDLINYQEVNNISKIPIIGRVAAGSPITAEENVEGSIVIDPAFIKKDEDSFALKVKGDSMIEAGIFEGDLVIISPKAIVKNGDMIVARLEDEVTVKIYENKNSIVKLIPQNKNYQTIIVKNKNEFSIVGKVTGVVRWIN